MAKRIFKGVSGGTWTGPLANFVTPPTTTITLDDSGVLTLTFKGKVLKRDVEMLRCLLCDEYSANNLNYSTSMALLNGRHTRKKPAKVHRTKLSVN